VVSRYVRLADRPTARIQPIDVRCSLCSSPPGTGCRAVRWLPERLEVVGGRVRSLPPGAVVTDTPARAHKERRELARREDARLRTSRRGH
jgi:hypothetical protein